MWPHRYLIMFFNIILFISYFYENIKDTDKKKTRESFYKSIHTVTSLKIMCNFYLDHFKVFIFPFVITNNTLICFGEEGKYILFMCLFF